MATWTCASASRNDVNDYIGDGAFSASVQNGDTVNIPAGTGDWDTLITCNKGLNVVGAGEGVTIIRDNITAADGQALQVNIPSGQIFKLSNLSIKPLKNRGTPQVEGFMRFYGTGSGQQLRMHHLTYQGWPGGGHGILNVIRNVFGLADHITWTGDFAGFCEVAHPNLRGLGDYGDQSWADATNFGMAGNGDAFYIEDSTLVNSGTSCGFTDMERGGGRLVVRFCTIRHYSVNWHGTESSQRRRGGRSAEVYCNDFISDGNIGSQPWAVQARSGVVIAWGNNLRAINGANPAFNTGFAHKIYRVCEHDDSFPPWAVADGHGAYDDNDGTVFDSGTHTGGNGVFGLTDGTKSWTPDQWISPGHPYAVRNVTQSWGGQISGNSATTISNLPSAGFGATQETWNTGDSYQVLRIRVSVDQPARGQSNLLSGAVPTTGWINNALEPTYTWMNEVSGAGLPFGLISPDTYMYMFDRDFYTQAANEQTDQTHPFNGSTGCGWGSADNKPNTGLTVGVGYFDKQQGSWNSGTGLYGTGYMGQGKLYVATGASSWAESYEPYTYPHPLQSEAEPPSAPITPNIILMGEGLT